MGMRIVHEDDDGLFVKIDGFKARPPDSGTIFWKGCKVYAYVDSNDWLKRRFRDGYTDSLSAGVGKSQHSWAGRYIEHWTIKEEYGD